MASKRETQELLKLLNEVNRLRQQLDKPLLSDKNLGNATKSVKGLENQIKSLKSEIDDLDEGFGGLADALKNQMSEWGKIDSATNQATRSMKKLVGIAEKLSSEVAGIEKLDRKQLKTLDKQAKAEQLSLQRITQKLKAKEELSDEEDAILKNLSAQGKELGEHVDFVQKLVNKTEERLKTEEKIEKTLGISGALVSGIAKSLEKLGVPAKFFEDIKDDMAEAAKSGSKLKTALVGLKGLGKGILGALDDPVVVFGGIFKGLKALYQLQGKFITQNKQAKLATSGAYGKDAIKGMESVYALFEELTEAANTLRTELGFVPQANQKILQGVNVLTHGYGLSGAEASNLYKISSELGIELKDMPAAVAEMGGHVEASSGHAVDFQAAMQTLGSASASVRFNMKGNAQQLLRAANHAAILGMSMDEIAGAAESTLDFENSIQKEMEAEMFLQKDLNLEAYRRAALTGDAETQAKELQRLIKENGPALRKNVLAQEAFAASIGISRDQLTASLEQMELQQTLGFKAEGTQERLNQLMAKGLTKEEALAKMRKEGAAGVTKAIKDEEAFQNRFKLAQRKFQEAFTVLADRIFSPENMGKIDDLIDGVQKFLFSPIVQGIIKYLPEIATGLLALNFLKKFNPIQNVGVMNVGMMRGGGGGGGFGGPGGGGGGAYFDKKAGRYRDPKTGRFTKKPKTRTRGRVRGRGLGGLALGLGSMLGMNMLMGGGDTGDALGMTAMDAGMMGADAGADMLMGNKSRKSNPKPKPKPKPKAPKGGGGFFKSVGNFLGGAKDFVVGGAKKIYGAGKSAVNFVGDLAGQAKKWLGGKIKGIFPKILKVIKKPLKGVLTKIPFVGAILEMLFTGMDVNAITKSKDMSPQEMYSEAGRSIISGGLGLTMGSLAAAAVSSLQAVGIPGWLISGAAYMGGDYLGRLLGDAISDHVGGPALGKAVLGLFGADKGSEQPTMMATGGIVTGATNAIVGEAGAEAVVPLNEFYAKIDELIVAVKQSGNIYLDGVKVGQQVAMNTSQL